MKRQDRYISQGSEVFEDATEGRVQVFVRIRPLIASDVRCHDGRGAVGVADVHMTQVRVVDGKTERTFQFDQVIPPDAGNEEVYQIVGKPLVEASLTGLNSILMAYGQTGAGKTHTLMASDGLASNIVAHMFALINRDAAHSYAVTCSYLQIYQEKVYDLLGDQKSGTEVVLREHPKKGVYVENLSEFFVECPDEICRLLKSGKKKLAVAETKMNRQSSRSHAVCLLKIERLSVPPRYRGITDSMSSYESYYMSSPSDVEYSSDNDSVDVDGSGTYFCYDEDDEMLTRIASQTRGLAAVRGKLYVCDLAGSERIKKTQAEGERLQEAQSINSSLLELGNVIQALAEGKKRHIPYRNSTLTRLLQDGLEGNSKTSLIVCVSPSCRDVNETLCSLKFGLRAMKVQNMAQVNIEIDFEKMAKQLTETLEQKEREWRQLKTEYERYIMALEAEKDEQRDCDGDQPNPNLNQVNASQLVKRTNLPVTLEDEALKNQTKAVLLAELVSMELFYGLEDLLRECPTGLGQAFPSKKIYCLTDRDLLLHSAETLLELTEYFFTKSNLYSDDATRVMSSTDSENAETCKSSHLFPQAECGRHSTPISDTAYTRKLLRVKEALSHLKQTTDSASLSFFSSLMDCKGQEVGEDIQQNKRRLHELLRDRVECRKSSTGENGEVIDQWKLEQSLCHVLMDKALINCLLLLDKADMESRIKSYKLQQTRFDYLGFNNITPVRHQCPSQCGDDLPPSPPLPRGRAAEGRLTSVDEGVVLESSSDSTNSREKLTAHFENTVEELEAENKMLIERKEQAENEKRELAIKVLELESKLKWREQRLAKPVLIENGDKVELGSKVEDKEIEAQQLFARVDELEDELRLSQQTVLSLKEGELRMHSQLREEKKRTEAAEEQRAKLQLKITQLQEKFEESELKLASFTGSDFIGNNKIAKQLESAIAENTELNVKILHLEEKLKKAGDVSAPFCHQHYDKKKTLDGAESQTKLLERKIVDLEGKLKEEDVKIASVKEYERRLRAELCKEMTKKLTRAQTRSRELGEKILELEGRLRDAEKQYTRVEDRDTKTDMVMDGDLRTLTRKLENSENRNRELSSKLQEVKERYQISQDNVVVAKQAEINLRERVQLIELEKCDLQDGLIDLKGKLKREPGARTAGRLEKVRNENANLAAELKSFRENVLKLEGQLLDKDQEILNLRNDSVDQSSDLSRLRVELDDSLTEKSDLERQLARAVEDKQKVVAKMSAMDEEITKLRANASRLSEVTRATQVDVKKGRSFETGSKSNSTSSTVPIGETGSDGKEGLREGEKLDKSAEGTRADVDQLLRENKNLQGVIDRLRNENHKMSKLNEQLVHDVRTLETNLALIEKTFKVCRSENECLLQEVNLKSAEATTVRTYASFCTEEAKKLKSELAVHRQHEAVLEKRLSNLESESAAMRTEMGRGISEFSDIKEKKESLEKKILEASRVVDQLKEEIIGLTKGMIMLQREIDTQVDKILLCLGLHEKNVTMARLRQRSESIDSNCTSTQTEASSEELNNEIGAQKLPFSCRLLPDKECFLNPSDVSVMRENKSEIRRLHEELKAKVLTIKDALSQIHDPSLFDSSAGFKVENSRLKVSRHSDVKTFVENETISNSSKSEAILPRLSKAERVKLSSLLTTLKEELIREKERNYKGRSACDGNDVDICLLYDNLESKLSRLSCELAIKEDEISDLLAERTLLKEELDSCEKGLVTCRHCNAKVPDALEHRRTQLKGSLLAHMQDTCRLETEVFEFMEYRHRLEEELHSLKSQIANLEDELDVRRILIERCVSNQPSKDESDSSRDDTDDSQSILPRKKRKSEKHVTFESIDSELEDKTVNKRRRQKTEKCHATSNLESQDRLGNWREADLDSSDLDLCELLESIPLDIPKREPTKEELEIAEFANRLSAYDNMSYDEKLEYATERKKSEGDLAETVVVKRVLFNDFDPTVNQHRNGKVGVDYNDELVSCQLCGLFRKRS